MLVADWVAQYLKSRGIEKIFVYPGGTIAPLIDSCLKVGITYECFKSEQGAGFAALAYSKLTRAPQVIMVTSGPGVTNVITPIADAFYDSVPLVVVTGQISAADLQTRKEVRQRGFQETPTVDLTRPISKKSTCLMDPEAVFKEVPAAFDLSQSGRQGPVVLDFPMNVQRTELAEAPQIKEVKCEPRKTVQDSIDDHRFQEIVSVIQDCKRPVILLGNGALQSQKFNELL
ncbi:MAG: thiamine pyrophosphate-binding protein, partial [Deltaproteobacteria bacterium]